MTYEQTPSGPKPWEKRKSAYTSAQETLIAGISSVVVDPHNEVLSYWDKHLGGKKAVLLHVDNHSDMSSGSAPMEAVVPQGVRWGIGVYAREHLNIASFISAGFHRGLVGAVYWLNPRKDQIACFGEVRQGEFKRSPKTQITDNRIEWSSDLHRLEPVPTMKGEDAVIAELGGTRLPVILDFDLDAVGCITDKDYMEEIRRQRMGLPANGHHFDLTAQEGIRVDRVIHFLKQVPRPDLITIARSQTPGLFTPAERIDPIQEAVVKRLSALYATK